MSIPVSCPQRVYSLREDERQAVTRRPRTCFPSRIMALMLFTEFLGVLQRAET